MGAGVVLRHQHSVPQGAGSMNAGSLELSGAPTVPIPADRRQTAPCAPCLEKPTHRP